MTKPLFARPTLPAKHWPGLVPWRPPEETRLQKIWERIKYRSARFVAYHLLPYRVRMFVVARTAHYVREKRGRDALVSGLVDPFPGP